MQRIVDGYAFEGKYLPDSWDVRVWENNGHREISARQVVEWTEIGPAPDWSHLSEKDPKRQAADEAERKAVQQVRSANRAKTACRRFIKSKGFDELATLTYRENVQDHAKCKADFREWCRRMARHIPGFAYCAGYEVQKRGAWHVHAAIYSLPEWVEVRFKAKVEGGYIKRKVEGWRLGTIIWRAVIGREDGGMCFIGGKGDGAKRAKHSLAKMAAYVAKYITKQAENFPEGVSRYTHSQSGEIPKAQKVRMVGLSLAELIGRCFWLEAGEAVVDHRVGKFKDSYYLCTELPKIELVGLDIT
jgi:hypothetical protein